MEYTGTASLYVYSGIMGNFGILVTSLCAFNDVCLIYRGVNVEGIH
jgi:hypothetical protein